MKFRPLLLTLITATVLAGVSAFADFIPGRVRPGYRAPMTATQATGSFHGVERGIVTLDFEDGKAQPVSITIALPGQKTTASFRVSRVQPSACGDRYLADQAGETSARVELVDYSRATCEIAMPSLWRVKLQVIGTDSALELRGNPEAVYVTL